MAPESGSCNNQVLESHTKAGSNAALEPDPEANKHENNGPEQGMDPGLEPRLLPKCNEVHPNANQTTIRNESPRCVSLSSPAVLDESQQWSMISVSPRSGAGNFSAEFSTPSTEWKMFNSSPMKPPSVQSMDPPAGYDPNRIPSSIFSTRPTTSSPMEWSVASNESLFSIQMGETKPEDWCNSPLHVNYVSKLKSNKSINFTSDLPPVLEAVSENYKKNSLPDKDFNLPTKENLPQVLSLSVEEYDKEKVAAGAHKGRLSVSVTSSNLSESRRLSSADQGARHSVNTPRASNESADSSSSFAFPLLVENGRSGRSCSPGTTSAKQHEEEPVPQTKDEAQGTPKPGRCNWFSCTMCWRPGCCFKLRS